MELCLYIFLWHFRQWYNCRFETNIKFLVSMFKSKCKKEIESFFGKSEINFPWKSFFQAILFLIVYKILNYYGKQL